MSINPCWIPRYSKGRISIDTWVMRLFWSKLHAAPASESWCGHISIRIKGHDSSLNPWHSMIKSTIEYKQRGWLHSARTPWHLWSRWAVRINRGGSESNSSMSLGVTGGWKDAGQTIQHQSATRNISKTTMNANRKEHPPLEHITRLPLASYILSLHLPPSSDSPSSGITVVLYRGKIPFNLDSSFTPNGRVRFQPIDLLLTLNSC